MKALNFNHLRYFWAVAHAGNLTRAAETLNLSPSALSVQIQKLEHQMGHPLFERAGKRLMLTEAGRIALDYADSVFEAGDELMSTLAGRPQASRQVLRVGALTTLSRNFQLEFLRPLVGRGDVELIVRSGTMRELLAQLEAHALDVVLSNSAAPRDARAPFRNHLLDAQPVSLVGRPRVAGHPPFRFPDDLRHEPILLPSLDGGGRHGHAAPARPGAGGSDPGAAHRRAGRAGERRAGGALPHPAAHRAVSCHRAEPTLSQSVAGRSSGPV